jgi:hypothetical protein
MELPKPPFHRRWLFILASVIGLAAISALLGWRGLQQVASNPTTLTTVSPTTTLDPPPTTGPPTSTSRPGNVLWEEQGSDLGRSPLIKAPSVWRIEWEFDCSNFAGLGSGGNFKITGTGAFERIQIENVAIRASGTKRFARGGFGHLRVESVCDRWTVRVLAG